MAESFTCVAVGSGTMGGSCATAAAAARSSIKASGTAKWRDIRPSRVVDHD
jgi:hypothetical protein